MGIYDREYYRDGMHFRLVNPLGPRWQTSACTWLIAINIGVFFLQLLLQRVGFDPARGYGLDGALYCIPERVVGHFEIWRLLTAAFCHSTTSLGHIFWNMLYLFFFGPQIERLYGRRDFVAFYLTVAVVANLVFVAVTYTAYPMVAAQRYVIGASGCGMALIVLCAIYFPHQIIILLFFPIPLWVLGGFLVLKDLFMFLQGGAPGIAHEVHLTGAALGVAYRFVDLRLSTFLGWFNQVKLRRRVRRTLGHASREAPPGGAPRFLEDLENQRMDRILEKIHQFGRESLTEEELEFLNRMSQRYRGRG